MKTKSTRRTISREELIHDVNVILEQRNQVLLSHKDHDGHIMVHDHGLDAAVNTEHTHLVALALALEVPMPDIDE